MFNILVTFNDIDYFKKIKYEDICQYKGYLPVYFKGYRIFGTPFTSLIYRYTFFLQCFFLNILLSGQPELSKCMLSSVTDNYPILISYREKMISMKVQTHNPSIEAHSSQITNPTELHGP